MHWGNLIAFFSTGMQLSMPMTHCTQTLPESQKVVNLKVRYYSTLGRTPKINSWHSSKFNYFDGFELYIFSIFFECHVTFLLFHRSTVETVALVGLVLKPGSLVDEMQAKTKWSNRTLRLQLQDYWLEYESWENKKVPKGDKKLSLGFSSYLLKNWEFSMTAKSLWLNGIYFSQDFSITPAFR